MPGGPRATRRFTDEPVPRGQIEQIVDAARWTGSARNRQPWRFVAVTDPLLRRRLAGLGRYAAHLAGAPTALVLLSDTAAGSDTEFDLGRVCQALVLAADIAGLGSCPVTLHPDDNAIAAARAVGAAEPWRAHYVLALGYPAPVLAGRSAVPTGRRSVAELLTHIGG